MTSSKIVLIFLGHSQTCKSSLINLLSGSQVAKVGNYAEGNSVTLDTQVYRFTSPQGIQFMAIDTQGLNDTRLSQIKDNYQGQNKLQALLYQLLDQINSFNPDRISFILTESLEGTTQQLQSNIKLLQEQFGANILKYTQIIATKYNPQYPLELKKNQIRLQALQSSLQQINQQYQIQLSIIPMHTPFTLIQNGQNLYQPPTTSNFNEVQFQDLVAKIRQLPQFPIQVFSLYKTWCNKRVNQLYNTEGIGYINEQKVEVTYKKETRWKKVWKGGLGRILGQKKSVSYEVDVPIKKHYTKKKIDKKLQ